MKNQAFPPKNPRNSAANRQSGNILFLIFIAVALFGALSWAMMQGNRANTGLMTGEQAKIQAQEIIGYGNLMAQAVKSLMINGCQDTQIGFDNTIWSKPDGTILHPVNHNPNTPAGDKCRIFAGQGGGMKVVTFESNGANINPNNIFSGHARIERTHFVNVGTTSEDLVYHVYYINRQVCLEINRLLGISNPNENPPKDDGSPTSTYNGVFNETSGTIGDNDSTLAGKRAFCAEWLSDSALPGFNYHFYQVLVVR